MDIWKERTGYLIGEEGIARLADAKVLLFGVGGVGSFVAEALVRAGVGRIELVDGDTVCETNLNRQLIALRSNIGQYKAEVMKKRALDINPFIDITAKTVFFSRDNKDEFLFSEFDYVADAIDDVKAKLIIAKECKEAGVPLISSMGTGGKKDVSLFRICDINKTEGDPLARIMRKELRKNGVDKLTVVYSPELTTRAEGVESNKFGTLSYVPSSAGLMMAGKIISDLTGVKNGL